jgi:serine/threonine protein kinase
MPDPTRPPPTVASRQNPLASAAGGADETTPQRPGRPTFGPPGVPGEVGTLGPYRVIKELGKGGMGAVYAALDTRLDRRLALKVMLPEYAADAGARERFLREARAAARIKHDNVVVVYEADERDGVPYIAMEFLEGCPLDEYLRKKGVPTIPQVLRIAAETAAGLAAAHKIGLVHRDIKPANLWLEAPHGRVKVLDFGLAKPVDAEVELTKSGAVVGTPAYMSPEQARGQKVDHHTDLFSLGAVLYRLCAGKLPFDGPTTMAVLLALGTEQPPPVRALNPAVPESLAALVHQLLSKRADDRPQSAAEVVKRLRAITEELTAPRAQPEQSTSQLQAVQLQVMYVPIQVTAAPEANPFADLQEPDTELASPDSVEPSSATAAPKPARQQPGASWLWPAVGFALLLAVVAGVIIIKNKDGTETKIEVPDGATVTVKDKAGKTLAQVGPGKQPADSSADRKAAEWVIGQGGFIRINGEGADRKAATELPKDRFTLTYVNLTNTQATDAGLAQLKEIKGLALLYLDGTKVSGAGLAQLKELKSPGLLSLSGTQVTDAGLAQLKEIKGLRVLGLAHTKVSDAGLANLKELKSLIHLHLTGTNATDEGLEQLKELKELTLLVLPNTKVTAKGLESFHAAVPGCKIEHNGGTIEPKK